MCFISRFILLILILSLTNCSSEKSGELSLKNYNLKNDKITSFKISEKLREISGLTIDDENRLFAVADEKAVVYELDNQNGNILKFFYIGDRWAIEDDFEGIEFVGNYFFLITSGGIIYKFQEAENGKSAPYEFYKTGLPSSSNIEGLAYDEKTKSLLIACKEFPGKKYKGNKAVYSFSLKNNELDEKPRFLINLDELKEKFKVKMFYPSGISVHPVTGEVYIISARGGARILTLDNNGKISGFEQLNEKYHRQPEGICFLNDNTMIIADEASGKSPVMSRYVYLPKLKLAANHF